MIKINLTLTMDDIEVIDISDKLPKQGTYPTRELSEIFKIDIHHSATLTSNYKGIETIKNFAEWHINNNGWPGIGYNYIIPPNDKIVYKVGKDNQVRWSVGNNNKNALSTLLVGNFSEESISDIQYQTALVWIGHKRSAYSVDYNKIKGHNEFPGHQSNSCPGIDMNKFRSNINYHF